MSDLRRYFDQARPMYDLGAVRLGIRLDTADIAKDLEQIRKQGDRVAAQLGKSLSAGAFTDTFKNNIVPKVDLRQLKALNAELDLKVKHYNQVQRHFNSRFLTPKVDLQQLKQLNKLLDKTEQLAKKPASIKIATEQVTTQAVQVKSTAQNTQDLSGNISKEIEKGFKQARLSKAALSGLTAPFRMTMTGFYEGIGLTYAQKLTGGMIKNLEKQLDTSLQRIGQKVGASVTRAGGAVARPMLKRLGVENIRVQTTTLTLLSALTTSASLRRPL